MIVTPEGLNVFPEDVERALNAQPGVRESAVVGAAAQGSHAERVNAVLVARARRRRRTRSCARPTCSSAIIRRSAPRSVWPSGELPRTEGTRKLKRRELKQWLDRSQDAASAPTSTGRSVSSVLERFAPGRTGQRGDHDRRARADLARARRADDGARGDISGHRRRSKIQRRADRADLDALTRPLDGRRPSCSGQRRRTDRVPVVESIAPGAAAATARASRRGSCRSRRCSCGWTSAAWITSLDSRARSFSSPTIRATSIRQPSSLRCRPGGATAWRRPWRRSFSRRTSFRSEFPLSSRLTNSANYYLASLFFNAFPLPQREAGTRQTLRYIGDLVGGLLGVDLP